ncbi:hypothetical protein WS68_12750 [Burkholderia sp. TSV86]|nr:hypothetical protein WS68_12750 [Burkholderia sp. TSV86]
MTYRLKADAVSTTLFEGRDAVKRYACAAAAIAVLLLSGCTKPDGDDAVSSNESHLASAPVAASGGGVAASGLSLARGIVSVVGRAPARGRSCRT